MVGYPALLWLRGTGTTLQLVEPVKVLGSATPIKLVAVNPHGVREFRAVLEQGGATHPVYQQSEPARRWNPFPKSENPATLAFVAGKSKAAAIRDGKAVLRLIAVSNDLRARRDELALDVEVNTEPPQLQVDKAFHTLTLGGSHVVTFTARGYWSEAGVRVGPYTFRSFRLPGAESNDRRVAFFGYPWDTKPGEVPMVFVRNDAGAEVTERIFHTVKRVPFRTRELMLSDQFLNKVLNELDKGGTGDVIARFVRVNADLRKANNSVLSELRNKTADRMLWTGAFQQLANTTVEAQFCDFRKYFYKGASVDEQVHLGFDLASVANAPVTAANDGQVVYAAPLGIYGNAVVVDHGLAVHSLYAHLNSIAVKPGDAVKKGQMLGRSGQTGMAGGDHLHFGVQVDGVSVNPLEWLDPAWTGRVMAVAKAEAIIP